MPNINQPAVITQKAPIQIGTPTAVHTVTPVVNPIEITKFQFRKLFSQAERVTIDNIEYSQTYSGIIKATVASFQKDMEVSNVVALNSVDVIAGINFLVSIGLLTAPRAARILANQPPL